MVTNFKEMYLIDKYLMNKLENIYNESGRPLPFNFKKSQNDEQVKSNDIFDNDFNANVIVNEHEQGQNSYVNDNASNMAIDANNANNADSVQNENYDYNDDNGDDDDIDIDNNIDDEEEYEDEDEIINDGNKYYNENKNVNSDTNKKELKILKEEYENDNSNSDEKTNHTSILPDQNENKPSQVDNMNVEINDLPDNMNDDIDISPNEENELNENVLVLPQERNKSKTKTQTQKRQIKNKNNRLITNYKHNGKVKAKNMYQYVKKQKQKDNKTAEIDVEDENNSLPIDQDNNVVQNINKRKREDNTDILPVPKRKKLPPKQKDENNSLPIDQDNNVVQNINKRKREDNTDILPVPKRKKLPPVAYVNNNEPDEKIRKTLKRKANTSVDNNEPDEKKIRKNTNDENVSHSNMPQTKTNKKNLTCQVCKRVFIYNTSFNKHIEKEHPSILKKDRYNHLIDTSTRRSDRLNSDKSKKRKGPIVKYLDVTPKTNIKDLKQDKMSYVNREDEDEDELMTERVVKRKSERENTRNVKHKALSSNEIFAQTIKNNTSNNDYTYF